MQVNLLNGQMYLETKNIKLLENLAESGFYEIELPYTVADLTNIKKFQESNFKILMESGRLMWAEPAAFSFCEKLNLELLFEITAYLGYAEMNEIIIWTIKIYYKYLSL